MSKFLKNLFFFTSLTVILLSSLVILFSRVIENRGLKNSETESNLLILKDNVKYDIAFMGISHARQFSRQTHQSIVEQCLNKKVLNLGQGSSICGVNEQLFYLKYFYNHGVKIGTILYILSPPLLYGGYLNQSSETFINEPFSFDFFSEYLSYDAQNKYQRLFSYIKSKLSPKWLFFVPYPFIDETRELSTLDTIAVGNGIKLAYLNGLDPNIFLFNCKIIERTIKIAYLNNSDIIFIIPPSLFGKWPGTDQTVAFCEEMKKKYGSDSYDFSCSVLLPQYYYDHHHFNSKGIEYFVSNYLKLII